MSFGGGYLQIKEGVEGLIFLVVFMPIDFSHACEISVEHQSVQHAKLV